MMLKGLKNLFIYKKPSEHGFRFPEDPQESDRWSSYRGKRRNLQDNNESDNSRNNQDDNQDQHNEKGQNNKNEKEDKKHEAKHDKRDKTEQARIIKPIPVKKLVKTVNDEGKKKDST
ncbi:MAG: hypothetical protein GX285_08635, partial [Clostridiales bacterium]|nr:hypothetical protein [Clostridiales bacterium]